MNAARTAPKYTVTAFASTFGLEGFTTSDILARAQHLGYAICSYSSPVDEAVEGLSVAQAMEIAREDAGLIYITGREGMRYAIPSRRA